MKNANFIMPKKANQILHSTCEICGERPVHHTHYIDENPKNKKAKNIQHVCTKCHAKIHGNEWHISELRKLIDYYKRAQKQRIACEHWVRSYSFMELSVPIIVEQMLVDLQDYEKKCKKDIDYYFKDKENQTDIYKWLVSIKGISNILAGQLIGHIDIDKTPGISNLWSYCGLKPEDNRRRGKKCKWNHNLKSVCYLIGESFIKARTPKYREIYDKEKEKQIPTCKKIDKKGWKGHANNRARRKMVKLFLKDLYLEWKDDY